MTKVQKQAVLVCVICVLAAVLTFSITTTILKRGKTQTDTNQAQAESVDGGEDTDSGVADHYQIDNTSSALLTETEDAGDDYLSQTLFIGDSNTVRLYNNGLISLQQFCAKEGIGTHAALNDGIVTFKNDDTYYTIAQAVAMMKPRRVVITLGTNDADMEVQDFINNYTALVQAIQAAYPYTDVIVNTVPPIPEDHSNYPNMDQTKIDDFNMALLTMCEQLGLKFLNTAEVLKDSTGYGNADYYTSGDIHLKSGGLKVALNYLRTHAYQTDDRRPDTSNIPTRTLEYASNPSSSVAASSSTETVASSAEEQQEQPQEQQAETEQTTQSAKYEAVYRVDKTGGGTLSSGNESGKTSLSFNVSESQSISVTAKPESGYVFVKWSDGVTSKTRTDSKFKLNLDVTAVFANASIRITSEIKGSDYVFKATLNGKYTPSEKLRWFANDAEVVAAHGQTTVTVPVSSVKAGGTYKIYAVMSYNDCSIVSNVLTITVDGETTASSSSSSHASSGSASSSTSSSSTSASGSSSSSSTGSTASSSSGASSASSSSSASSVSSSSSSSTASSASESTASKESSKEESTAESKSESKAESASESKAEKAEIKSKSSS